MSVNITCDTCGRELNNSHGVELYAISLNVVKMPMIGTSTFDVYFEPDYAPGRYDFCGRACLLKWAAE